MSPPGAGPTVNLSLLDAIARLRREVKLTIWVAIGIGSLSTIAVFVLARTRFLVHMALPTRSEETVAGVATLLLFWCFAVGAIAYVRQGLHASLGYRLSHRLSVAAVVAAADTSDSATQNAPQALADVEEVSACVSGPAGIAMVDVLLVPAMLALLSTVHWMFLAVTLVGAVVKVITALTLRALVNRPLQEVNSAQQRAFVGIADAVNAAEAVDAMGMLPGVARRWMDDVHGGLEHVQRTGRIMLVAQSVSRLVDVLMGVAPMVTMIMMAMSGIDYGLSGPVAIIAIMVMPAVVGPFTELVSQANEISGASRAWQRLRALGESQAEVARGHSIFLCPAGRLEVDNLSVVLPGQPYPIISDLTFRVGSGQVIAFSGPVGSGKSTLLRTIMGIQRPSTGGCYLDGHATWQWDRRDFARHVGFLPQELGLADGTVADAIARLGVPDMALVLEAAQRSGAHGFIVNLPRGYATRLSEHGLSAGQRQRLGLARAIYGRPRVVILDEPGAWLDAKGLAELRRLVNLLRRDNTTVLISSHEPILLDEADHTIELGRVGVRARATSRRRVAAPSIPAAAT